MEKRLLEINPELEIQAINEFLRDEAIPELLNNKFDYIVDAIDTLAPRFSYLPCYEKGYPIISSLGSGSKLARN